MPCSKGMRRCVASCGHRRFVREYQSERARQEIVADDVSRGYHTEYLAYIERHPLITFKKWLTDHAGQAEEDYEETA